MTGNALGYRVRRTHLQDRGPRLAPHHHAPHHAPCHAPRHAAYHGPPAQQALDAQAIPPQNLCALPLLLAVLCTVGFDRQVPIERFNAVLQCVRR